MATTIKTKGNKLNDTYKKIAKSKEYQSLPKKDRELLHQAMLNRISYYHNLDVESLNAACDAPMMVY